MLESNIQNIVCYLYDSGAYSINQLSKVLGISTPKIRKILYANNRLQNGTTEEIEILRQKGFTDKDISKILKLSPTTINMYASYSKGIYNDLPKTKNALAIERCRAKKQNNMSSSKTV